MIETMIKGFTNIFRPAKAGLARALGDLEKQVMDILWLKKEAAGREVFTEIRHSRTIAITTVLTVLERLVKKGIVKRLKSDGIYIYTPVFTREEFADKVSQAVMKGVLDIAASSAVASFVDILADTDPEELDRLLKLIEKKKKELYKKAHSFN